MKAKVAVLYGGWAHESLLCAYPRVSLAVKRLGYTSCDLRCDAPDFIENLVAFRPDVAFLASHGAYHEDGKLQALLEWLDIPYTGSSVSASAVGMNKVIFKRLMQGEGVLTAPWLVVERGQKYPSFTEASALLDSAQLVLKPVCAGSSVGLSLVDIEQTYETELNQLLVDFRSALIEHYVAGSREFSVGVHDFDGAPSALPVCELHTAANLFNFEMKNGYRSVEKSIPANISADLQAQIQETAIRVHQIVGAQGVSRIDLLLGADRRLWVLEINTLPGLMPQSVLPHSFAQLGTSYEEMISQILSAAQRPKRLDVAKQFSGQKQLGQMTRISMLEAN